MNGIGYDKVLLNPPGGWATGERPPAEELGAIRRILPDAVEEDVHVVLPQQPSSTGFPGATLRTVVPANGHVLDDGLSGAGRQLVTVDPAVVAQTGAPAAVVDALEEGKVVIFGGAPASGPKEYRLDGLTVPFDSTDVVVFALRVPRYSQIAAISPATAEAWGAQTLYYGTLFDAPADLTSSQRRRLEQFGDEACSGDDVDSADCHDAIIRTNLLGPGVDGATTPFWSPEIGFVPTPRPPGNLVRYGYAGILLAFTLLVVAIALALSAAESRDERALLAAIGAPPSIRRSTAAWQAGLLPGIAMLVAVPGGIAVAPLMVSGVGLSTIPWLHLAAVAVGIPLASATAAWLGTAITTHRRSIRPRDLSPLALAVD